MVVISFEKKHISTQPSLAFPGGPKCLPGLPSPIAATFDYRALQYSPENNR